MADSIEAARLAVEVADALDDLDDLEKSIADTSKVDEIYLMMDAQGSVTLPRKIAVQLVPVLRQILEGQLSALGVTR